jgi:hypothetical protein
VAGGLGNTGRMAGSQIDNSTRTKLERLFDMSSGYVLDFTNASFAAFVRTCLGFDPYTRYQGSKAAILREIWLREPFEDVARLNIELLDYWFNARLANSQGLSPFEERTYQELAAVYAQQVPGASPEELDFLSQDLGSLDLASLPGDLTAQQVLRARLTEIERCLEAEAPLAVIFLVGSTLEGLLLELALAKATVYASSSAAPLFRGTAKPIKDWSLADLIKVSRALGVVGEDVLKHADHVRNFRNYIHPRQQMHEKFEPRLMTAQIAHQVLLAVLADLKKLVEG